jgi:hypothetical protein
MRLRLKVLGTARGDISVKKCHECLRSTRVKYINKIQQTSGKNKIKRRSIVEIDGIMRPGGKADEG